MTTHANKNKKAAPQRPDQKKLFVKKMLGAIREDEVAALSAQTAYYFIVSIVPFLIVFLNIGLFFAQRNFDVVSDLLGYLPKDTAAQVKPIVDNIIQSRAKGSLSVIIGLLVALWSSSNATNAVIQAMNKAFNVELTENFVRSKVKSIVFTVLLILIMFLVLFFMIFGDVVIYNIANFIHLPIADHVKRIISFVKYILPILGMIGGFFVFYKKAPNFNESNNISWKSALLGSLIATLGWLLISIAFNFYVTRFSNMPLTYGPLFGIFTLFIWLNLSAMIIILSAEFISIYDQMKKGIFISN